MRFPAKHSRAAVIRPSTHGFSLIEIIVVLTIVATALLMYSSTVASVAGQQAIDRENVTAAEAARTFVEKLRDEDFRLIYRRYNADASDDPGGPGTAPGHRFAVADLDPGDSPDGLIGEVTFPGLNVALLGNPIDLELRENVVDAAFGTPRDLNGDSIIDDADHTDDYLLLPLEVVLRWSGSTGDREMRTFATLCEFNWE